MKVVIVRAERQGKEVDRLIAHIKRLDGTIVMPIPAIDITDQYPARNNFSLHQAATILQGQPFFWLEPDSIPLRPGWLAQIEREYQESGKEFLLSSDSQRPFDLIGGIGVYGPNTASIIPMEPHKELNGQGWDMWMLLRVPSMIAWSPSIQHSYGVYNEQGTAEPHRFPRDNAILRDNALVFHRDKHQDLIDERNR